MAPRRITPKQLRTWRTKRGFSQRELSLFLGRGERGRTIQDWELGRRSIPPDLILTLEALDARLRQSDDDV